MSRLATRLARIEAHQRAREDQQLQELLQAASDKALEEFIERLRAFEQSTEPDVLTEDELRERLTELKAWLRWRASQDD